LNLAALRVFFASMAVANELIAGGIAGSVGILATQPMDTIRIRLQSSAKELGLKRPFSGIIDCASTTLRHEGLRGLYKGIASPTLTVGAMNAVLFFSYEYASRGLRAQSGLSSDATLSLGQVFLAGSASGFASAFITAPTELVKCIAQTNIHNQGRVAEEWQIFRNMTQRHGWLGPHGPTRGLFATIVRDCPSFGLYFLFYEASLRKFGDDKLVTFAAGGGAGVLAWSSIYPLDVVKTRWQTAAPGQYSNFGHCARSIVAQDGWRALFRGFGATMARAWPQNGFVFCTYEMVKGLLPPYAQASVEVSDPHLDLNILGRAHLGEAAQASVTASSDHHLDLNILGRAQLGEAAALSHIDALSVRGSTPS